MGIFKIYFVLTILLSIVMHFMGLGMPVFDPVLIFTSGIIGVVILLPLFTVIIYAIIASTLGSIRSFKLLLPNEVSWQPSNI